MGVVDVIRLIAKHDRKLLLQISPRGTDPEIEKLQAEIDAIDAELGMVVGDDGQVWFEHRGVLKGDARNIVGSQLFRKRMALQQQMLDLCDPEWVANLMDAER